MPIGDGDPQQAVLQTAHAGTTAWRTVDDQTAPIGSRVRRPVPGGRLGRTRRIGSTASAWARADAQEAFYTGSVGRTPAARHSIDVAMVNCTIHSYRSLEEGEPGPPKLPGETFRGLYTTENLYFPYAELVANIQRQTPDLLVAFGDQYYENGPLTPTAVEAAARRALAVLPVAVVVRRHHAGHADDLPRRRPRHVPPEPVGMVGTRGARIATTNWGGYIMPASWVNTVQRIQCAHNPDAYDPTPVLQGITVYYAAFSYGGVSFAVLEDRKFKNTNKRNEPRRQALAAAARPARARQEAFLRAWAAMHPGQPKVCLTQTLFAMRSDEPERRAADATLTPTARRSRPAAPTWA